MSAWRGPRFPLPVLVLSRLFALIEASGHRPAQEQRCASSGKRSTTVPTSATTISPMRTLMPVTPSRMRITCTLLNGLGRSRCPESDGMFSGDSAGRGPRSFPLWLASRHRDQDHQEYRGRLALPDDEQSLDLPPLPVGRRSPTVEARLSNKKR